MMYNWWEALLCGLFKLHTWAKNPARAGGHRICVVCKKRQHMLWSDGSLGEFQWVDSD